MEETRARGQLLMYGMRSGWSIADRDTLRWVLERARAARIAQSSSFAFALLAYDAFNQGSYSTARVLLEDSIELCRDFRAPHAAMTSYELAKPVCQVNGADAK